MNSSRFQRLVLDIYQGVSESSPWSSALDTLRAAANASGVTMLYQDPAHRAVEAFAGFSADVIDAYHQRFQYLDPWGLALDPRQLAVGRVVDGRRLVSDRDVRRTEYFADFGRQVGSAQSAFCPLELEGPRVAMLVIGRGHRQKGFDVRELAMVERLVPHFRQAFRLYRRLTDVEGRVAASVDAIESLPHGVVLLDAAGSCVVVNRVARAMAESNEGITIYRRRLRAKTPGDTQRLEDAIGGALALSRGAAVHGGNAALNLARPPGRSPLRVVVVPVRPEGSFGAGTNAAAAVFITDPDAGLLEDATLMAELFSLTPTEARVALQLVNGGSVDDIADSLMMSRHTVRWHIKHILQKGGVRTQAQLVARVLRSPAWVRQRANQ